MKIAALAVVVTTIVLAGRTGLAEAGSLVPYQATGWRYVQIGPQDPGQIAEEFFAPGFDDSEWATGRAAFGWVGYGCGEIELTIHTHWDASTSMLLRREFFADPLVPVVIHFAVDNDANIWVNGVLVASVPHAFCPVLDEFSVVVPANVIQLGSNLIAVQAMDRGGFAYFDARIEGDSPTPTLPSSWGRLKGTYR